MNSDPGSLNRLRDIAEPDAVSWWPPAIGWWILFAAMLVGLVIICFRMWLRYRADAYRRAAISALDSATTSADVSEILKRAALVAFTRSDVASLSGAAWCRWLGETASVSVPDSIQKALTAGVFAPESGSGSGDLSNSIELREFAESWIRNHRNPSQSSADAEGSTC